LTHHHTPSHTITHHHTPSYLKRRGPLFEREQKDGALKVPKNNFLEVIRKKGAFLKYLFIFEICWSFGEQCIVLNDELAT
jgi:hypothetical protein